MKNRILALTALLAGLASTFSIRAQAGGEGYYIQRNGVVEHAPQGDPSREHPDVWRFKLYRKGEATSGTPWGGITGKSIDSITNELTRGQADELAEKRACECDHAEDTLTWFNPLGPIAVYYMRQRPNVLDQTDKIVGRIADLEENFERAAAIFGDDRLPNPFKVIDSPAWRFLKQLHETKEKFAKLNDQLFAYNNEPLAAVSIALGSVNRDLNNLENTLAPQMQESLKNRSRAGSDGNDTSWMNKAIILPQNPRYNEPFTLTYSTWGKDVTGGVPLGIRMTSTGNGQDLNETFSFTGMLVVPPKPCGDGSTVFCVEITDDRQQNRVLPFLGQHEAQAAYEYLKAHSVAAK